MQQMALVEKWGIFEAAFPGRTEGNPFTDYTIRGTFESRSEKKTVDGFYDGDGIYRVRFMPSFEEEYTYTISGSFSEELSFGTFRVTAPGEGNHGPVRVAGTYHFAYEDGKPYYSIGTTAYVWELQAEQLQKKTLETLKRTAFNKIRFCIFPKHYVYNFRDPVCFPYMGTPMDASQLTEENFQQFSGKAPGNDFDYTRFNVKYFQHVEKCIGQLMELGIQADLILMHPYDRWGFSVMSPECDDLYMRYIVARVSAYRNVWWALANEYDLMDKSVQDWERLAGILCEKDAYNHPRSIHNCIHFYDHTRPWITHCSIQRQDLYKTAEYVDQWRIRYNKPVVLDEISYEGNIQHGWGNISGKELTRRFWEAFCRGGYAGHGETYMHPDDILWWSHGGELHGECPERLLFLQKIMEEVPAPGLKTVRGSFDEVVSTLDQAPMRQRYYIYYYTFNRPSFRDFYLDDTTKFHVEVIDTWNMTIEDRGIFQGKFRVTLPGREYMAVRIREVKE